MNTYKCTHCDAIWSGENDFCPFCTARDTTIFLSKEKYIKFRIIQTGSYTTLECRQHSDVQTIRWKKSSLEQSIHSEVTKILREWLEK